MGVSHIWHVITSHFSFCILFVFHILTNTYPPWKEKVHLPSIKILKGINSVSFQGRSFFCQEPESANGKLVVWVPVFWIAAILENERDSYLGGIPIRIPNHWGPKPPIYHGRLTWNLQITHSERKMIFETCMIMFHVNLQGVVDWIDWTCEVSQVEAIQQYRLGSNVTWWKEYQGPMCLCSPQFSEVDCYLYLLVATQICFNLHPENWGRWIHFDEHIFHQLVYFGQKNWAGVLIFCKV